MLACLTLSIIRCGSSVKWSNPRNGIAPSPKSRCSSYWTGNLWVTLDYFTTEPLAKWVECSPMVRETEVQSQVDPCQRLKKSYLMPPCLTFSIIRWWSRVKWCNPGNGVAPCPPLHFGVVAIGKGEFKSPSTKVANFTDLSLSLSLSLFLADKKS